MALYRCLNCFANFHNPIIKKYTGVNYWCEDDKSYCPFCKSQNIEYIKTEQDEQKLNRLIKI